MSNLSVIDLNKKTRRIFFKYEYDTGNLEDVKITEDEVSCLN